MENLAGILEAHRHPPAQASQIGQEGSQMVPSRAGSSGNWGEVLLTGPPVCCLSEIMYVSPYFVCACEHVHACIGKYKNVLLHIVYCGRFPLCFTLSLPHRFTRRHARVQIRPRLSSFRQGPPGLILNCQQIVWRE